MTPNQLAAYHTGEAGRYSRNAQLWRKMGAEDTVSLKWMKLHVKAALKVIALSANGPTHQEARRLLKFVEDIWA